MRLLFIIIFSSLVYCQNWVWQNPLPQGKSLKHIFAVNENTAFAIGEDGAIIKTINGGENWSVLSSGVPTNINTCFFLNENVGYAAGDNGVILKTNDGGQSFKLVDSSDSADIHTLFFFNELSGYAAGSNGTLLITSDGGNNWTRKLLNSTKSISDIFFISGLKGWYVGEEGTIKTTNDGGVKWIDQNSNTNNILSSIFFIDQSTGWVCGNNGTILKTTDGGNNWLPLNSDASNWLKSLIFIDQNNGVVVGEPGIILKTADGGNTWDKNDAPTAFALNSICKMNNNLIIVGQSGIIISSSDMGANWEFKSGGWNIEINDLFFKNENDGIAVGKNGFIITTTDGGSNWVSRESGTTKNLNAIGFNSFNPKNLNAMGFNNFNPNQYYVAADSATILFSNDKGITWSVQSLDSLGIKNNFYGIAVNSSYIKIAAAKGIFAERKNQTGSKWRIRGNANIHEDFFDIYADQRKTNDVSIDITELFGQNGVHSVLNPVEFTLDTGHIAGASDLYDVFFLNNTLRAWAVGKYGIIAFNYYQFGGEIWRPVAHLNVNALYSVFFVNIPNGYTVGTNGAFYKTFNGGFTWYKANTGVTNLLKKIFFVNENIGWITGANGVILKTANSGNLITSYQERKESLPDDYYLAQNYPNPFNPSTTISFKIPKTGFVSLKIFDMLGNEIETLVNETRNAGEYSVDFNGSNLSSGVYFYRLTAGDFSKTKKLLLIK